jgi:hypothetical protein
MAWKGQAIGIIAGSILCDAPAVVSAEVFVSGAGGVFSP